MTPTTRQRAIELYDRFTHDGMERRTFMAEMAKLAGSFAAAELLVARIAANANAAPIVQNDPRISAGPADLDLGNGLVYQVYTANPVKWGRRGTVLVIHENRGLNEHIRDVTRRLALAGMHAIAPDFLSPLGGTPLDEDKARAMIGKLDLAKASSDAVAMLDSLRQWNGTTGKVGAVGFCWGGGFVNRLAVAAGDKLDAAVVYYGPAPDPSEAAKVKAPIEFHNGGLDARVNATSFPWITALRHAGKRVKFFLYEGANHAFNNDTSAERYDKPAADLAWKRTLAFLRRELA